MAKVKQPIKEFWESNKKPDFLVLSKRENDTDILRVKGLKSKRKVSKIKKIGVK